MKQVYFATFISPSVQLQLSPSISSAAQNQSLASCGVRASDMTIPTTGTDVQDIVTRYMTNPNCNLRLRVAIEKLFTEEYRNEEWAGALERIVKEAAQSRGAQIAGVCHTSLCRFDIELPPSAESARSPHAI